MNDKIKTGTVLNVLSLEDSVRDFEIIREQLTDTGYNFNIYRVEKEGELTSLLRGNKYDIILADFKLPGFDAFGALRLCKEICPEVPFICVSGAIGEDTAIELIKQGAVDYVLKDRLARLPFAIKRALEEVKEKEKRKLAEEALIVSESRYRRLFESAKDGILIIDAETGKIIDVNPFLVELLSFPFDHFIGKSIWEIGFFNDIIKNRDKFIELQQKVYVRYEDLPLETTNGQKIDVEFVSNVYSANHYKVIQCNIRDITDRKRAEKNLQHSETQYRSLTENSPDLIARFDRQYRHLYVNQAAAKAGRYTPEEYIGKTMAETGIPEPEALKWEMRIGTVFETGQIVNAEDTFETPEGLLYFNTKFVPEVAPDGSILSVQSIARDVTEHKRAEEKLKFRNLLLLTQQETTLDGILVMDEDGKIISWNKRFLIMWGISFEEMETKTGEDILRSTLHLLVNPDQYSLKVHYLFIHTDETSHDEINLLDGRWFERYTAPMIGSNDKYYGRVWSFHDITIRKKSEEELNNYHEHLEELVKERTNELARERNMLRTLIDTLPDEIYAKDGEGRFIMANYPVLRSFRLSAFNDILGKTDFDFLPKEEAMKAYAKEHSVLQHGGQMINYGDHIIDSVGKIRWLAVTKAPMRDKEGNITGLVGINRDITYFKEAEEALKKAKEAAEAANIAKSTFLSNMSHEIRTPLSAILGFSELMQRDDNLTKKHIDWLKTINRSGEHLLSLINDILEVSRIEAGRIAFNPSNFNLHALLHDMEAMFRIKTDAKNLTLLFEFSDDLPGYIVTDEGKLKQIIINLVGNAVKFTKEGGVALRARAKHENDKTRLVAEIEDTGPGIPEKDIDKLFRKFGQTEAGIKEGGTGLGLAISQQYAKFMGGMITVKSEEGKGACFTLTIDIENGKEPVKEENQKRRVIGLKPGQKPYRILIADDRAANRELLRIMLTTAGFEVEEAQNGNEAIAKFKVWSPDLILMDMRMPVMDGYEAIRGIRAIEEKKTPIIAVTASVFHEDRQVAQETGADAYLRKPFREYELFERIESCLAVQYLYR